MKNEPKAYNWEKWTSVLKKMSEYGEVTQKKLRQKHIDYVRYRAMMWGLKKYLKDLYAFWNAKQTEDDEWEKEVHLHHMVNKPKVEHLWFTSKDLANYELRKGNPPADSERPSWMRGLRIELDYHQLPPAIWAKLAPNGEYAMMLEQWGEYTTEQKESIFTPKMNDKIITIH